MNLDLSALGAAEQAQLAALLAKAGVSAPPEASAKTDTTPPAETPAPRKKRARRTQVKYFTQPELEQFFRVVQKTNVRDYAIFRVMYHRGLRASEIGALQFADLDLKEERLHVTRKKGSRGGLYHLTANEVRALRPWVKLRGTDPGPLFPSRQRSPISQQRLDKMVKHYGSLAGLPPEKCHCHTFKHACGTHLAQKGYGLEHIQDHLGHKSVENSRIYSDFGGELRQARDKRLRDW
jgi:integrase